MKVTKELDLQKNSTNAPKRVDFGLGLVYYGGDETEGGILVKIADVCRDLIKASGLKQSEVARKMGWQPPNLSNRLRRNTLSADEFTKFLDALGYEMKIVEKDSGDEFEARNRGVGPRLQIMVNGVSYDTHKANAICHSETENDMFIELYRDSEGRYFVACYVLWEGGVSTITPIGEEDAAKLVEKYATE